MKIKPTQDQKKMLGLLLAGGLSLSAALSGVFLTGPHEGKVNTSYNDPVGILTACYGHTGSDVKPNTTYTDLECMEWLISDLRKEEKDVEETIHVPLNLYQKAALDDFVHNIGPTKFKSSTMVKMFNAGDYKGGCEQLVRWVYAGNKKLPGLEKRRNLEMQWCLGNVEVEGVFTK